MPNEIMNIQTNINKSGKRALTVHTHTYSGVVSAGMEKKSEQTKFMTGDLFALQRSSHDFMSNK